MIKQPFIIDIQDGELPNLARDSTDAFGFEYSQTDVWQDDSFETVKLLNAINEKMDIIIRLLQQNGRE